MSLVEHALWPTLRDYVKIQPYMRDGGPVHPRHRIEMKTPESVSITAAFLDMVMPCVKCGLPVHPIRRRQGGTSLYVSVSCPTARGVACRNSGAAAEEYERIVAEMEHRPRGNPQPMLF